MRLVLLIALSFSFVTYTAQAASVEKGGLTWYDDLDQAHEESVKTNKVIFGFFTGSDWCGWCKLMQSNVFAKQAFIDWAKENVVLLELDFPKRTQQTVEMRTQNQNLQRALGVSGYPTVWLFVSKKNPETGAFKLSKIGKLGYPSGATKGEEEVKFLSEANELLAKNKS